MNYSVIEWAKERYIEYDEDYQKLVNKINLQLFTLPRTNFSEEEKNKVWRGLLEHAGNINNKVEEVLNKLENIRFSEGDFVLQEERDKLVQKYNSLLNLLRDEKSTILRQFKREVMSITPLRQKTLKVGYCYFDDISLASGFPYKLEKEEQKVLDIEVPEGAEFCSQECLLGYCREYRKREKLRQEEEKRNKEKIVADRKLVSEIQTGIRDLTKKINELERKERDLMLASGDVWENETKKVGFFQRLGQKFGWVKDNSPRLVLERVKKSKIRLEKELDKKSEDLQKALVNMSVDEQVEKERQKLEKKHFQEGKKLTFKEENDDE